MVNDIVVMGLSLVGSFAFIALVIFWMQERQAAKRAQEFRMFQMENTRLMQQMEKNAEQRHMENEKFFKGLGYTIAQIFERVDREQKNGH